MVPCKSVLFRSSPFFTGLLATVLFTSPASAYMEWLEKPVPLTEANDWCEYRQASYLRSKGLLSLQLRYFGQGLAPEAFVDRDGRVNDAKIEAHALALLKKQNLSEEAPDFAKKKAEAVASLRRAIETRSIDDTGYTECFKPAEFPTMIFCLSQDRADMTATFTRMSGYFEGLVGTEKGQVAPLKSRGVAMMRKMIKGHNLKGLSILNFWNEIAKSSLPVNAHEAEFQKVVFPRVKRTLQEYGTAYLAAGSSMEPYMTFGHELLHGPWELDREYRRAVHEYVDTNVDATSKAQLADHIGEIQNGDDDQFVNEFQAYTLMPLARLHTNPVLRKLSTQHREPLEAFMRAKGFSIPYLQPGTCEPVKLSNE